MSGLGIKACKSRTAPSQYKEVLAKKQSYDVRICNAVCLKGPVVNSQSDLFLKQSSKFYMVEVAGDRLLYRPTGQKALHLDKIASFVWQLCDGDDGAVR